MSIQLRVYHRSIGTGNLWIKRQVVKTAHAPKQKTVRISYLFVV